MAPENQPGRVYAGETIGAGNPGYKIKIGVTPWVDSSENEKLTQEIQEITSNHQRALTSGKTNDRREYAMPLGTQFIAVIHRSFCRDVERSTVYFVSSIS